MYRITEESVQDNKEQKNGEDKKAPSPPQRAESQDAIPIKSLWVTMVVDKECFNNLLIL